MNLPMWKAGSTCGCYIDLDAKEVIFSLDGQEGYVFKEIFTQKKWVIGGLSVNFLSLFIAAMSLDSSLPPRTWVFNNVDLISDRNHLSTLPRDLLAILMTLQY